MPNNQGVGMGDQEASRRRAVLRGVVVLSVSALVAAACGSSKSSTATNSTAVASTSAAAAPSTSAAATTSAAPTVSSSAATTAAAAPAKDPVNVVALIDVTGPSAAPVGLSEITKATVDSINAAGGLAGHPITLQIVDAKGDPAAAQAAVDASTAKKPVAYLLGTAATETAISVALSKTGAAILGQGYSPSVWGGSVGDQANCKVAPDNFCAKPNFLTIGTTFGAVVQEQVLGAQAAGAKVLATAACAEVDSCSAAAPVFDGTAKALGLATLGVTKVASTATDYTAPCLGFISGGADFIQISGSSQMGVNLMKSCADQGYAGLYGASAGSVNGDLIKQPYKLAGGLNGFPWWVDDAPVATYRDVMTKAKVTADQYSNPVATGFYSALLLLQKAVKDHADAAKPLDAAAVLDAMYQVKAEGLGGLIAPVTFTKDNLDRNRPCFWPYVKDVSNKFTNPLGGLKFQCFPPQAG